MAGSGDATVPATRRPRKSTGQSPARKRLEKENITIDVASTSAGNASRKKSRSKSMGPGGVDVLKAGTGNRRVSLAAPARPPPRSILKPTMPQLPEIPPHKPKSSRNGQQSAGDRSSNSSQNDDSTSSGTKIALRTEEEQQAAARIREEEERAALDKEIKDRREARRKSLANRRVSFAAEATLHTFHEIECMQDSTTSTDSTRRASSLAAQFPASAAPSTSAVDLETDLVLESPKEQDQKKNQRVSSVPPLNFNNPEDETLASTVYSSDSEATDGVIETHEEINSDSDMDSEVNDGTTVDLVVDDEVTGTSVASGISARSISTDGSGSNDTLENALRQATRRARTQSIGDDEEVIPSFGWGKKAAATKEDHGYDKGESSNETNQENSDDDDGGIEMDMDMTNAMGGIINTTATDGDAHDEELSMDVTTALGGILPRKADQAKRKSSSPHKRMDDSLVEEATMDLTVAMGGIRQVQPSSQDVFELQSNAGDEDMSMEFTTVIGGVIPPNSAAGAKRNSLPNRRKSLRRAEDEGAMDMTVGLGRILPGSTEANEEPDDAMDMDMTVTVGGIVKGPSPAKDRSLAKQAMEEEADHPDAVPATLQGSPVKKLLPAMVAATIASDSDSPGLSGFRGTGLRRSTDQPRVLMSPAQRSSPLKSSSPFRDVTPKGKPASTPLRTPPAKKVASVSTSSHRPSPDRASSTPRANRRSSQKAEPLFRQDPSTGDATPRVVLTPQSRRLSGLGVDRSGLGSPKVAEIMDRRGSIGEFAQNFVPGKASRGVTFADPRLIEEEIDKDRRAEEDRENMRSILGREVDGGDDENTAANLKDMISSMSPKKNASFKSRKSLHIGSAKGLLGKRPLELDDEVDEDIEQRDGVKRLKGHQSSPVKNVRLHAPPSKAETTGRISRSNQGRAEEAGGNTGTFTLTLSPGQGTKVPGSPSRKSHFYNVAEDQATGTVGFDETLQDAKYDTNGEDPGDRIHLQDFLNMTSIRFMELTTTKRRHTQAPAVLEDNTVSGVDDMSLESCVVAGACTVPMLELYQHSCRELKKYISEGRRIVREMETETFEENPPLFQEYMTATPDFKSLMDNQFKNVKTHARLLSKAMWYEWRMKLQDGLREGLLKISEGMDADAELLAKEEKLLQSVVPGLVERCSGLQTEHDDLESAANELADCDPEELKTARADLAEVDGDLEARRRQIEELQELLMETETGLAEATQSKQECIMSIAAAEKIREECRGWTSNEINSLKVKVENIERQYGWNVTGIQGTTISMTYRREIELVFDISSFQAGKSNSSMDLWYIAAKRDANPRPATPDKEFFVQCIRDHIRNLDQATTKISSLLQVVSSGWEKATTLADNIRLLHCVFPTEVFKTSDSSVAVVATMFLAPLDTKARITLGLQGRSTTEGVEFDITPHVQVVYGEHLKIDKMCEYLATRLGGQVVAKEDREESWNDVVAELYGRLLARGKK